MRPVLFLGAALAIGCSLDLDRLRHGTDLDASADSGMDAGPGEHDAGSDASASADTGTDAPTSDAASPAPDGGRDAASDAAPLRETACGDGMDNDGDALTDCADPDCDGVIPQTGAVCTGGAAHETACMDGVDNDGDLHTDCTGGDPDCAPPTCGSGCSVTGCVRHETSCGDGADNDSDGFTDCADTADCPMGTLCRVSPPTTCSAAHTCM